MLEITFSFEQIPQDLRATDNSSSNSTSLEQDDSPCDGTISLRKLPPLKLDGVYLEWSEALTRSENVANLLDVTENCTTGVWQYADCPGFNHKWADCLSEASDLIDKGVRFVNTDLRRPHVEE